VQFHPESIASEQGHALLANFLELAGFKPNRKTITPPIGTRAMA
jgi:anthranilate synthase component II